MYYMYYFINAYQVLLGFFSGNECQCIWKTYSSGYEILMKTQGHQ